MHSRASASLLLVLICISLLLTALPQRVEAQSPVLIGIRLWNYNATHVVPDAEVTILNGTNAVTSGVTNLTGWVTSNLTVPNPGDFTLRVRLHDILVYNGTLNVNSTLPFRNVTGIDVTNYAFHFSDNLSRSVENVRVDLRINSSLITSALSASNGSAVVRNLPFTAYNVTASRQQVEFANSTVRINATTYSQATALGVPTYDYSLTVRDHAGADIVQTGTVSVYDVVVSTNNATRALTNPTQFQDLWPGRYWVIVKDSYGVDILRSIETIRSNFTQSVHAKTGYSIRLSIFDVIGRPVPSVKVDLILNGAPIGTQSTGAAGSVTFDSLPMSHYILNLTLLGLGRTYTISASVTDTSLDLPVTLDDIFLLAGTPFSSGPIVASATLLLTVTAALGTFWLYRRRTHTSQKKEEEKESR